MIVIKNGNSGATAKVGVNNQLFTFSETITEATVASLLGDAYNVNTGAIDLTSTNKSAAFYFKNTSQNKTYSLPSFFFLLGNSASGTGDVLISLIRNSKTNGIHCIVNILIWDICAK